MGRSRAKRTRSDSSSSEGPSTSSPLKRNRRAPALVDSFSVLELADDEYASDASTSSSVSLSLGCGTSGQGCSNSFAPAEQSGVLDEIMIYEISDDEIEEDRFQLVGENISDSPSDIPVRLLHDFTIYDVESRRPVHIAELIHVDLSSSSKNYGASGQVRPWVEDEDDDVEEDLDEDDPLEFEDQRMTLSRILELNTYHISSKDGEKKREIDKKLYIRTKFAWYIIDMPTHAYVPLYADFFVKHHVVCLIVSLALSAERVTYDEFLGAVEDNEYEDFNPLLSVILGRALTKEDLELDDMKNYIIGAILNIQEQDTRVKSIFSRSPLIRAIKGAPDPLVPPSRSRSHSDFEVNRKTKHLPEKPKVHTVVTPTIHKIAKPHFRQLFVVAGKSLAPERLEHEDDVEAHPVHYSNPSSIQWSEASDYPGFFKSVDIDGARYSIGDVVIVPPGDDADAIRARNAATSAAQTKNHLANHMWFCKIRYFYQSGNKKMFHATWFDHGSKTNLQELANPASLFLLDECEDSQIECIVTKAKVSEVAPGEDQPFDADDTLHFHHGFTWKSEDSAFVYRTPQDDSQALAWCEARKPCPACGRKIQKARSSSARSPRLHIHDFVYLLPHNFKVDAPYQIGQVVSTGQDLSVTVRLYGRFDDIVRRMRQDKGDGHVFQSDERRLVKTAVIEDVDETRVVGRCHVTHPKHFTRGQDREYSLEEWLKNDDCFYARDVSESCFARSTTELTYLLPEDLQICTQCHEHQFQSWRTRKALSARHTPLQALELFSGAGGLSIGLGQSSFVQTKWAVELSESAALTYEKNHRETIVYNEDINTLLQHTLEVHEGKRTRLRSSCNGKTLPAMPLRNEVDLIYGGPPCQSFSGANYNKEPDDHRSALICNFLSWVDYYRPTYFLLENVVGLLSHQLNGRKEVRFVGTKSVRSIVGGVQMGMIKFILRAATHLGYQVHFKVLQAAQYGSPQGRERVIFIGARCGVPLPRFPIPTHSFVRRRKNTKSVTGDVIHSVNCVEGRPDVCSAPFYPVTVQDAISDLPAFDWKDPHAIMPSTMAQEREASRRRAKGIKCLSAHDPQQCLSGFQEPVDYASEPMNRYQRWMRARVADTEKVSYHYTKQFNQQTVECVVNVPLRPDAEYSDLPAELRHGQRQNKKGVYGRIDGNGSFRTAMTNVNPNARPGGTVLHPTQKRIITVRECARAQGFPDDYLFVSTKTKPQQVLEDQIRQIGNAVPVPLGLALGKALGESMEEVWKTAEREGSVEL